MTFDGATLFAIEESPLEAGLIWTGSNDGQIQLSRNGGATWQNMTQNIPNLPPWGTVSSIHPSKYTKGTGENMVQAAIKAAQLGMTLSDVAGAADNLLDFQSVTSWDIGTSVCNQCACCCFSQ